MAFCYLGNEEVGCLMILGELETTNFRWVTLTNTPEEALENLRNAWEYHAEQTGAWYTFDELSTTLTPISLGCVINDCHKCENLEHICDN